jgi:hypothetical protein
MYDPSVQLSEQVQRAAAEALEKAKQTTVALVKKALRDAGVEVGKGFIKKVEDETMDWWAWGAGALALAGVGYYVWMKNENFRI